MPGSSSRPYQAWTVHEIASNFWYLRDNQIELEAAIAELKLRTGAKARNLEGKLAKALVDLKAAGSTAKTPAELGAERFMAQAMSKLREKLIDIGKRNPLIAFKHSERGATFVRVVDELPDEIFSGLLAGAMKFEPLPNPDQEPADQRTSEFKIALESARLTDETYIKALESLDGSAQAESAVEVIERALVARVREGLGLPRLTVGKAFDIAAFARANGFDPSFSLQTPGERDAPHLYDDKIRVLYTRDRLEARLRTIYDRYRSHAAETGIHTLQLAFGFVEWPEADGLKERHVAPLLLMPVQLQRVLTGQKYVYSLSGEDENLVVNMALQEMLRRQFNIELPEPTPEESPETYFAKIERIFTEDCGLKLERFVTLAVLPFPNMAVWRDLDPNCWPSGELLRQEEVRLLMGATGGSAGSRAFPNDYDVQSLPAVETPPLVMAADVSQHSALVDVQRGNSLALEGPPGTGKSQTIANMIAGALSRGKTVLFFAEKKAALDIVSKRLEELGFGPLLLELYSGKATKSQIIADLKKRLEFWATADAAWTKAVRQDLAHRQDLLKRYRTMLRVRFAALDEPVNSLVWREMKVRGELEDLVPKAIWTSEIAGATKIDPYGLKLRREALTNVENSASSIFEAYGSLTASAWHAADRLEATPFGQESAMTGLRGFLAELDELMSARERNRSRTGVIVPDTLENLEDWSARMARLPDARDADAPKLSAAIADLALFKALCRNLERCFGLRSKLAELHPHPEEMDDHLVAEAEAAISGLGLERASMRSLGSLADSDKRDLALLETLLPLAEVAERAGVKPCSAVTLLTFAKCVANVSALDDETLSLRSEAFLADGAEVRLARGRAEAKALCDRQASLEGEIDLPGTTSAGADKLFEAANTILQASILSPLFSPKYRNAVRLGRNLAKATKAKGPELAALLNTAATYLRDTAEFAANDYFQSLFRDQWRGHHSNFVGAEDLARRLSSIHLEFLKANIEPALRWLVSTSLPAIRAVSDLGESRSRALERFDSIGAGGTLRDTLEGLHERLERIAVANAALAKCGVFAHAELGGYEPPISELVRSFHGLRNEIAEHAKQYPWFSGVDEDLDLLHRTVGLAEAIFEVEPAEDVVLALRMTSDVIDLLGRLRSAGGETGDCVRASRSSWSAFEVAQQVRADQFFAAKMSVVGLSQLEARTNEAIADERGLRLYADLLKSLANAAKFDLQWIYEGLISRSAKIEHLADTYELALIRTLLQRALQTDGAGLTELAGAQLADASARFIAADEILERLEADRIIAERLEDRIPQGTGHGPKSGWTDEHLIQNEIGKVRRHIPMRDLVTRAHGAMQALKPVWLMSPTSVAQFVSPGTASFDLVIIDEASQMTPEMAVGALARGSQIVVVGDPKQLPPSNWFRNKADSGDDDEDDGDFNIETESILDLAFSRLSDRRRLKWHYRSQHASLIQFSNRQFYERELVIFPSPIIDDELLGVKSRFVGGAYEARINEAEAKAVIEALVGLIFTRPELSFGVVTMNAEQRELIFQEFERIKQENKTVRQYVDRLDGSVDELFIKNLENVQGDERDIILISTLYGPPPGGGKVLQRFGIFTRKDGHRRLNVLVTRARRATILFTSLRPADVVITENSSEGVQAFKAYLSYAEGAPTAESEAGGVPDSDFEEFVARRIESHGYQVVPQVGVEGFRIDLGVKHPEYPSGFLAGVECDGAGYHSHLCVRDRDRIRQEVLERLGWNIYRVWSTDWFNDPTHETAKLIAWLDDLRDRYKAKFERASQALEAFKATPPAFVPEPEGEGELEPSKTTPEPAAAEPTTPTPTVVLRPPPGAKARVDQGELFTGSGTDQPQTTEEPAQQIRGPTGKRHVVDGIEFYESMTGFFEVWIEGREAGTVERVLTSGASPARVYGGAFHAQKPTFLATRAWDETTFATDDIYVAVRRLAKEYGEQLTETVG